PVAGTSAVMARLRSACCRLPSACCACWSAGRDPRPLGGAGLPVRLPLRCCGSAATDVALAATPAPAANSPGAAGKAPCSGRARDSCAYRDRGTVRGAWMARGASSGCWLVASAVVTGPADEAGPSAAAGSAEEAGAADAGSAAAPTEPALPEEVGPAEGEGSAEDLGADAGLPGAALARSPCLPPPPAWACPAGAFDMPTPLSTKPATPWSCSGSAYSCALTERLGSESPPIVCSTPPWYLVTTSTCPSNSTQSPGWGVYPSSAGRQRPWFRASCTIETTPGEAALGSTRLSTHECTGHG